MYCPLLKKIIKYPTLLEIMQHSAMLILTGFGLKGFNLI